MALENDDLLVVQKSGGGELRKAKISDISGKWTEDSGKLYPTTLTNNVQIGGTAADPNIVLNAEGYSTFNKTVKVRTDGSGTMLSADGAVNQYYYGTDASTVALVKNDGSFGIGGDNPDTAPNIELAADGLATISQFLRVNNEPNGDQHVRLSGSNARAIGVSQVKSPGSNDFTARINWDGSAEFAGGKADIGLQTGYTFTSGTGAKSRMNGDGIYQLATDGTTVSANILANGSASFTGNVKTGNGLVTTGDPGAQINANGLIASSRVTNSVTDAFYIQVAPDNATAKEKVVLFKTDGSAIFESNVTVKRTIDGTTPAQVGLCAGSGSFPAIGASQLGINVKEQGAGDDNGIFLGANGNAFFSGSTTFAGIVTSDRPVSGTPADTWACWNGKNKGTITSSIKADGSASFAGKVGIGIDAPDKKLHVKDSASTVAKLESTSNVSRLELKASGTTNNNSVTVGAKDDDLQLAAGMQTRVTVESKGNVGIGTDSPSTKFVVSNSGQNGIEFNPNFNSNQSIITSYNRNTTAYTDISISANQHLFVRGGDERMRIDKDGKVGIGTTAPTAQLTIGKSSANTELRVLRTVEDPSYYAGLRTSGVNASLDGGKIQNFIINIDPEDATAGSQFSINIDSTQHLNIDDSGTVGIGGTLPSAPNIELKANGKIKAISFDLESLQELP